MTGAGSFGATTTGGSLVRALRPALLCAASLGLLPLSVSGLSWRLLSRPAARCALLSALVLALLVTEMAYKPRRSWLPATAADVYNLTRRLHGPILWAGVSLWTWLRAPRLEAFFIACREHEQLFGALDLRATARYVRRFVLGTLAMIAFCVLIMVLLLSGLPSWLEAVTLTYNVSVYGGVIFWLVIFAGSCRGLEEAFLAVNDRLQTALQKENVPQLRRLVVQHGQLSQLAELLCGTFGGLIASYLYMLLLDVTLSIYMNARAFTVPTGGSLVVMLLQKLITPLPLTLLKLVTSAGHDLSRQSERTAGLLQRHLVRVSAASAAQDPALTELLQLLHGQHVHMDMAGYFTLDRSFFVQSIKDIVTLMIAMAQFEMA